MQFGEAGYEKFRGLHPRKANILEHVCELALRVLSYHKLFTP